MQTALTLRSRQGAWPVRSASVLWSCRCTALLERPGVARRLGHGGGHAEPTEPMLHRRYKSMTSAKRRETWSRGVLACLRSSHAQCENRQRTRRRELAVVGQHLGATTGCAPARSHQQACGQASATTSFAGFFCQGAACKLQKQLSTRKRRPASSCVCDVSSLSAESGSQIKSQRAKRHPPVPSGRPADACLTSSGGPRHLSSSEASAGLAAGAGTKQERPLGQNARMLGKPIANRPQADEPAWFRK